MCAFSSRKTQIKLILITIDSFINKMDRKFFLFISFITVWLITINHNDFFMNVANINYCIWYLCWIILIDRESLLITDRMNVKIEVYFSWLFKVKLNTDILRKNTDIEMSYFGGNIINIMVMCNMTLENINFVQCFL